ncbi:phage tail protein [Rhodospirillum sp. A1_3_36]|uniref:phage tail protein n=1 Tax=Rhodospirillum sp. A1_3_36 TaxID=3391666 RepID=UPI0039A65B11
MVETYLGEIRIFAGERLPRGWDFCRGQLKTIAGHEALFAILGTTYGGDGTANFALPDLRGRLPMHKGTGEGLTPRTLGQKIGVDEVTLTAANLPAHSHAMVASSSDATEKSPKGAVFAAIPSDQGERAGRFYATEPMPGLPQQALRDMSIEYAGDGKPLPNRMPTTTMNFIISLFGAFPT